MRGESSRRVIDNKRLVLPSLYSFMRSTRYDSWWSILTLRTCVVILKLIIDRTGSQCKFLRTGSMWSRRRAPVTIRARQSWTHVTCQGSSQTCRLEAHLSSPVWSRRWHRSYHFQSNGWSIAHCTVENLVCESARSCRCFSCVG